VIANENPSSNVFGVDHARCSVVKKVAFADGLYAERNVLIADPGSDSLAVGA
jgi:hypothetical protein